MRSTCCATSVRWADAASEPRDAAGRDHRRSRARSRVRQPGVSARRRGPDSPRLLGQALDRVPAASSRTVAARCCGRGGTRSCSSSTTRPRSPRGTGRARNAGARTTTASSRGGRTPVSGRRRSTPGCTRSGSTSTAGSATTTPTSTRSPTARSSCATVRRGSSTATGIRRWTPAGYADALSRPAANPRARDHTAVARGHARCGLGADGGAAHRIKRVKPIEYCLFA